MSAIITESFRRNSAQLFLNDIIATGDSTTDGPAYYVGIGKSEAWSSNEDQPTFNVTAPRGTAADALEVMNNISALKKVRPSNVFNVFPNIAFTPGKKYKVYDPNDDSCFYASGGFLPCFVTTSAGTFLCLVQGNTLTGAETTPATTTTSYGLSSLTNSDGYVWTFIQPPNSLFVTEQFIDVGPDLTPESSQAVMAKVETGGYVYGFSILNGGTQYSVQDTFRLVNPDSLSESYALTPVVDNAGAVISLSIDGSKTTDQLQFSRLTSVSIVSATGSGAVIIPKQAPLEGFGYSPKNDLPAWFAALDVTFTDDVGGDALYSPYRQISVIKNPTVKDELTSFPYPYTAKATRYLKIQSPANSLAIGDAIKLSINGPAVAYVDSVYSNENDHRIYFHQNYSSGFTQFIASMALYIGSSNIQCTTAASSPIANGEYTIGTGTVLFTENRKKITRASGQSEEIKIIIQF